MNLLKEFQVNPDEVVSYTFNKPVLKLKLYYNNRIELYVDNNNNNRIYIYNGYETLLRFPTGIKSISFHNVTTSSMYASINIEEWGN